MSRLRLPGWRWIVAAGLMVFWMLPLTSSAEGGQAPAAGKLLVADEQIGDPRFRETVILLIEHGRGGAAGLILNRPSELSLSQAGADVDGLPETDQPLFYGGPVAPRTILVLLQSERAPKNARPVRGELYLTGLPELARHLKGGQRAVKSFRGFAGYAGWAPTQLAAEIARGDWHVREFDPDILTADPQALWPRLRSEEERIWI